MIHARYLSVHGIQSSSKGRAIHLMYELINLEHPKDFTMVRVFIYEHPFKDSLGVERTVEVMDLDFSHLSYGSSIANAFKELNYTLF